jgi:hypothetical protein
MATNSYGFNLATETKKSYNRAGHEKRV